MWVAQIANLGQRIAASFSVAQPFTAGRMNYGCEG